jgi:hypothetical protein
MVTKIRQILKEGRGFSPFLLILALVGCSSGEDNSPSMGAVAPKPNPNMSAELPADIKAQMAQAKPGADAGAMDKMKPHSTKP